MGDSPAPALDKASPQALLTEYEALLGQAPAKEAKTAAELYPLLLHRDRIAAATHDDGSPSIAIVKKLGDLDGRLKSCLRHATLACAVELQGLAETLRPPDENWWWRRQRAPSPWWTIGAVLFLTFSVTLITDFTRRVLGADPDEVGILSVGVQALLAVAATSTFTDGGRQWIEVTLRKLGVRPQYQPRWKLCASLVLFLMVFWAWERMPGHLAWLYNKRGLKADSTAAQELFLRAIAMNPEMPQAHFNLGEAYEKSYEYDKASAEYQQAIYLDPSDVRAYANLSRLLTIGSQYFTALRVADDGSKVADQVKITQPKNADPQTIASLQKDRAWAEYQLGFYSDAEKDAKLAAKTPNVAPSAYCVLGKVYTQQKKTGEAEAAWKKYQISLAAPGVTPPVIEPDCTRLAEAGSSPSSLKESSNEKK